MAIRVMLTGRRRRGKDVMADQLVSLVPGLHRTAFADALKREVADALSYLLLGKPDSGRRMLAYTLRRRDLYGPLWQAWGEMRRQAFGEDYWIRQVAADMAITERWIGHPAEWVITDCRHHNEAAWGKANGFVLVRITGPYRGNDDDQRDDTHPSERFVDELPADREYQNTGTLADMQGWLTTHLLPACGVREGEHVG